VVDRTFVDARGPRAKLNRTVNEVIEDDSSDDYGDETLFGMMTRRDIRTVNNKAAILRRVAPTKWDSATSSENLIMHLVKFSTTLEQEDFTAFETCYYLAKQVAGENYDEMKAFLNKAAEPYITRQKIPWKVLRQRIIPEFAEHCTTAGATQLLSTPSWKGRGSILTYYKDIYMIESINKLHHPEIVIQEAAIRKMAEQLKKDGWVLAYSEMSRAKIVKGIIKADDPKRYLYDVLRRIDTEHDLSRELNSSTTVAKQQVVKANPYNQMFQSIQQGGPETQAFHDNTMGHDYG